jgi:hypothetical protein
VKNNVPRALAFAIAFTLITLLSIPTTSVERAIQHMTQNTISLAFTMWTTD